MSNEMNDGMVDVHAEVVGSKEIHRGWIGTMWAWRKSFCLLGIGIFLIMLGLGIMNPKSKISTAASSAAMKMDQAIAEVKGPDLELVHRDAVELANAVRNGRETEIRSWWRSMLWSNKAIETESIKAAGVALSDEMKDKSPEVVAEIRRVQESLLREVGQMHGNNVVEAGVKLGPAIKQ